MINNIYPTSVMNIISILHMLCKIVTCYISIFHQFGFIWIVEVYENVNIEVRSNTFEVKVVYITDILCKDLKKLGARCLK